MESPFLDQEIVADLTGFKHKSKQALQLVKMGLPFILNGNGVPRVLRIALEPASERHQRQRPNWKPSVKF